MVVGLWSKDHGPRTGDYTGLVPEIIVELAEGRTVDQKRELVKGITDVVVRVCSVDAEAVVVIIHENPKTDKAKGGVLFSER